MIGLLGLKVLYSKMVKRYNFLEAISGIIKIIVIAAVIYLLFKLVILAIIK